MPAMLTKDNVISELEQPGALSELLRPEQFAQQGKVAEQLAEAFVNDKTVELKPTQLRKTFHALKEKERKFRDREDADPLGDEDKREIYLLIPQLAYARGRGLIPQTFYELMRVCLSSDKLKTIGDFRRLVEFITAILAYHKYHEKVKGGGR